MMYVYIATVRFEWANKKLYGFCELNDLWIVSLILRTLHLLTLNRTWCLSSIFTLSLNFDVDDIVNGVHKEDTEDFEVDGESDVREYDTECFDVDNVESDVSDEDTEGFYVDVMALMIST